MKVSEIMTPGAVCVRPGTTLAEAATVLRQLDVGALPVCDQDRLTGILTDRDIATRAVADGREPDRTPVRDAMSPGVVFIFEDQDIEEAAAIMARRQIRRLPVLNRDHRLVGMVSLADLAQQSRPRAAGAALREISAPESPGPRVSDR